MGVTKRVFQVVYMCRRDPSMHGVIEIAIQSSNIRELYTVLFTTCFTLRVRFLIAG